MYSNITKEQKRLNELQAEERRIKQEYEAAQAAFSNSRRGTPEAHLHYSRVSELIRNLSNIRLQMDRLKAVANRLPSTKKRSINQH